MAVCDTVPLTAVLLVAAVGTVAHVVTVEGPRDAAAVATPELGGRARAGHLATRSRRSAQFRRLVPAVPAVGSPVAHLAPGQAGVRRAAGEGGAVLTGGFVTAVTAVVLAVAEEPPVHAARVAAGELILPAPEVTCRDRYDAAVTS